MNSSESRMKNNSKEKIDAWEVALRRLSVREHSVAELRSYLKRRGAESGEIEEVLERLIKQELLNDERFMRVMTRDQAARGKGPRYILMKLKQKGVKADLRSAQQVFDQAADQSELDMARQVLERRYPRAKSDIKERQRAFQGLLRRGFSSDVVRKALFEKGVKNLGDDLEAETD